MQIVDVFMKTEQTVCGLSYLWCYVVALIKMSLGRGDSVFSFKAQCSLDCCTEDFSGRLNLAECHVRLAQQFFVSASTRMEDRICLPAALSGESGSVLTLFPMSPYIARS